MIPFEGFQTGLMTGAQLGSRAYQAQGRRKVGGLMASGDYSGAANAAYGSGDLESGLALTQYGSQQETSARNQQIGGLVASGDYGQASAIAGQAGDLDSLAQIKEWQKGASEEEQREVRERAGQFASIGTALRRLPVEQRLAQAQTMAPQFGLDPSQITPEMLTDEAIEAWTAQALGTEDYLGLQLDREKQSRPIVTPYGIIMPPGSDMGSMAGEDEWEPINPNQPVPGQPELAQQAGVSFNSSQDARQAIARTVPGVTFTSGFRDPERNRRVGGAPNSYHTKDRAWDLVPPPGMSMAQLAQTMRAQGFRALDEGDHVHVSW